MTTGKIAVGSFLMILVLCITGGSVLAREYASEIPPGRGIAETVHDLRHQLRGNNLDLCLWCHAPHQDLESLIPPLWDQKTPDVTFSAFPQSTDIQGSDSGSSAEEISYRPGPTSMLCLSCHDGVNASNQYGYLSRTPQKSIIGEHSDIGHTLLIQLKDHPIGVDYGAVEKMNVNLHSTTVQVNETLMIGDLLKNGKMECVTCHDVHNSRNRGEKLLWISDAGSNLCFTCHNM